MNVISERFADELCEKAMRDAYLSAQTRTYIARQIRALRAQRGWSQSKLGEALGKPQSNVSRLEDREYGKWNLHTLLEVASAFDVGLIVKFAPYEEFITSTTDLSESALSANSFKREALEPLTRAQAPSYKFWIYQGGGGAWRAAESEQGVVVAKAIAADSTKWGVNAAV